MKLELGGVRRYTGTHDSTLLDSYRSYLCLTILRSTICKRELVLKNVRLRFIFWAYAQVGSKITSKGMDVEVLVIITDRGF